MQSDLCYILQRLGRLDEAISHCDESLRLKPDFVAAHLNRGTILAAEAKNEAAETEFSRVLALDPSNAEARAELDHFRALLGAHP